MLNLPAGEREPWKVPIWGNDVFRFTFLIDRSGNSIEDAPRGRPHWRQQDQEGDHCDCLSEQWLVQTRETGRGRGLYQTYCKCLIISSNESKKKKDTKIFTAQFPEMWTTRGLAVNWLLLTHSLLCRLRDARVSTKSVAVLRTKVFPKNPDIFSMNNLVKNRTVPDGRCSRTEVWL